MKTSRSTVPGTPPLPQSRQPRGNRGRATPGTKERLSINSFSDHIKRLSIAHSSLLDPLPAITLSYGKGPRRSTSYRPLDWLGYARSSLISAGSPHPSDGLHDRDMSRGRPSGSRGPVSTPDNEQGLSCSCPDAICRADGRGLFCF